MRYKKDVKTTGNINNSMMAPNVTLAEVPQHIPLCGLKLGIYSSASDFTFTFHFHALEKEMANYSSVLAWRIPGTGEPGKPPSMGSHRVGHD